MADYYEQFSDQLDVELTEEERLWIEDFLIPFDPHDGIIERGGDTLLLIGEDGVWTPIGEKWKREHGDVTDNDEYWPQFSWKIDGDGVWMHDDGGGFSAEHVVEFVHAFIKAFRPKMVWKMTWADTCSKPRLGSFGGGWAVVDINGATFGSAWRAADEAVRRIQDPWSNDRVQFARLISEIRATQDFASWADLYASVDLDPGQVNELFDRAHKVWEDEKAALCPPEDK